MVRVRHSSLVRRDNTIQETTLALPVQITVPLATTGQEHAFPAKRHLRSIRLAILADVRPRNF